MSSLERAPGSGRARLEDVARRFWPDALAGLVVAAAGSAEARRYGPIYDELSTRRHRIIVETLQHDHRLALVVVAVLAGVAVAVARAQPLAALALAALLAAAQVYAAEPVLLGELGLLWVLFCGARWGRPVTLFLSGLAIPAGTAAALLLAALDDTTVRSLFQRGPILAAVTTVTERGSLGLGLALLGVVGAGLLGLPWLAGLAVRFSDSARRARRASEQATEIAQLRDGQARLARDVHDVVGHSLAVILAQAESAQYLPADDGSDQRLRSVLADIATSARGSLQDVRGVLTPQATGEPVARQLDELLAGVRRSGHEVDDRTVGVPRPLPPERETVAYRVLQEMLTNAIRHGRRDTPIVVERTWTDDSLRIEVRNAVDAHQELTRPIGAGQGLAGMRRRLDSVGGRVQVRPPSERTDTHAAREFSTTAWLPTRTR